MALKYILSTFLFCFALALATEHSSTTENFHYECQKDSVKVSYDSMKENETIELSINDPDVIDLTVYEKIDLPGYVPSAEDPSIPRGGQPLPTVNNWEALKSQLEAIAKKLPPNDCIKSFGVGEKPEWEINFKHCFKNSLKKFPVQVSSRVLPSRVTHHRLHYVNCEN
ncbi:uncharacterized protein LOC123260919 [Cotesia glomerata]|uniref:Uncharacterized protein n=1 Tax=Cotesia glomerata TaxID=32391 RepID=A0AAV7HVT5_COTGL|nr:uncharacterized protein LOC123260919 [Cotesia glomerata]KAH0549153.1 hypothetical protein KQX54_006588 [Cotesia glomerata]